MQRFVTIVGSCIGLGIFSLMLIAYFDNRAAMQQATQRAADIAVTWWGVFLWTLLVVAAVATFFILWLAYQRSYRSEPDRIRDGSAQLREYRIRRSWRNLWMGIRLLVDPNLMQGAAALIDDDGYQESAPIAQPVRVAIQQTRTIAAVYPGDDVLAHQRGPRAVEQPRLGNPARVMQQPPVRIDAPPALPAPPSMPAYTAGKALNESTVDGIVLGQADDGNLCRVNLRQALNIGVIGAPGTGKTASTGFHLALALRKAGARLVILDPKGGADWRPFARVAEWHNSDYTVIRDQMQRVFSEYERRAAIAQRAGVSHLMELRDPALPPLVVIIEEYGDLCRELRGRGKAGDVDAMDAMIDSVLSKGRYTDVHFVLIDQYPEAWSNQVMMATKAKIIYQVGPSQGTLVGDWHAQQLPDNGVFRYKRNEYNAWHIAPNLNTYLAALPAYPYPALIDGSVQESVPDSVPGGVPQEVDPTPSPSTNTVNTPTPGSNEAAAREWIQANPEAGVNALARHLATVNGRADGWRSFQSEASRWWHKFNPAGNDYQSAPTDAFGRPQVTIDVGDPSQAATLATIRAAIESGQATVKGRKP